MVDIGSKLLWSPRIDAVRVKSVRFLNDVPLMPPNKKSSPDTGEVGPPSTIENNGEKQDLKTPASAFDVVHDS